LEVYIELHNLHEIPNSHHMMVRHPPILSRWEIVSTTRTMNLLPQVFFCIAYLIANVSGFCPFAKRIPMLSNVPLKLRQHADDGEETLGQQQATLLTVRRAALRRICMVTLTVAGVSGINVGGDALAAKVTYPPGKLIIIIPLFDRSTVPFQ
jgi:hypothetical protein